MDYKITIIIPLFGRIKYTKIWLKENIRSDFFYIFADGSLDKEHEKIFSKIILGPIKISSDHFLYKKLLLIFLFGNQI